MEFNETISKKFDNAYSKFSVHDGKREFVATITTNQVDRDGDVIDPKGIDYKEYLKNPVIFLNHEAWELPIGKTSWLRRHTEGDKSGMMAKGYITDKTGRAVEAFGLMQDRILTTTSIGFGIKPGGAREPTQDEQKKFPGIKRMIEKSTLYEFSVVGIPANTDAVIQQVSKMQNIPDWLGMEQKEVGIDRVEEYVDTEPVVKLQPTVSLEKVAKIERLMSEEEIVAIAKGQTLDEFEVKVLGKVSR